MNILDLILILLVIFFSVLGGYWGVVKTLGFSFSIIIGAFFAYFLFLPVFALVKPFFAANENYGKITCYIAIFTFFATIIQLIANKLNSRTAENKNFWTKIGGIISASLLSSVVLGLLMFLVPAFAEECKKTAEGCPDFINFINAEDKNSFVSNLMQSFVKKILGIFID